MPEEQFTAPYIVPTNSINLQSITAGTSTTLNSGERIPYSFTIDSNLCGTYNPRTLNRTVDFDDLFRDYLTRCGLENKCPQEEREREESRYQELSYKIYALEEKLKSIEELLNKIAMKYLLEEE